MKRILLPIVVILLSISAKAQKDQTIFGNSGVRLTGVWGGWTSNINSFEDDFDINNGGHFAFELNKSILLGWSNEEISSIFNDGGRVNIKTNSFLVGYSPTSYKSLHPYFYTSFGNGTVNVRSEGEDRILSIQPTIGLELNVLRWFRISVDGGYRFISGSDFTSVSDQMLSGPYIGLRTKFGWSWGR